MRGGTTPGDAWRQLVLGTLPLPAWLSEPGPEADVVLSSRFRAMRNLQGHRFPHAASSAERISILNLVLKAAESLQEGRFGFRPFAALSPAERDYMVACRLVSADFGWQAPGTGLLLDSSRTLSIMVNEEDHLRFQALTPGSSTEKAEAMVQHAVDALAAHLAFAHSARFGHLSASPFNAGPGLRRSAMFHLIGLASSRKLPGVLRALVARGLAVRGLYGEASRAIGAFVQVSSISTSRQDFAGACAYLVEVERAARQNSPEGLLQERMEQFVRHLATCPSLTLPDALRLMAWARWGAESDPRRWAFSPRDVDQWLVSLELRGTQDELRAGRDRAGFLRARLVAPMADH